jgi:DNA-binding SARP family transcriptional activator
MSVGSSGVLNPGIPGNLAVCLLGGPFVIQTGKRIAVPDGCKKLLVFVALHNGRVDRRHAAGTLWPDVSDERASGNLRSVLWRLRGAGIEILEVNKMCISLRRGTVVDINVLFDWAGRVIGGTATTSELTIPSCNFEAFELLPGWYDDWVIFERERLRQRLLHGLESLCCVLSELGRHSDAVEAGIGAVEIDPLRESAQRSLIEAHLAEGNIIEAYRVYKAYERLVHQELGVSPSQKISSLFGSLISSQKRRIAAVDGG